MEDLPSTRIFPSSYFSVTDYPKLNVTEEGKKYKFIYF